MSVDATPLGKTAAACMESLEERFTDEDGEVVAVGIVVVVSSEGQTLTRTFCSRDHWFEQVGLFEAALSAVRNEVEDD